jgi:hypothetical protein
MEDIFAESLRFEEERKQHVSDIDKAIARSFENEVKSDHVEMKFGFAPPVSLSHDEIRVKEIVLELRVEEEKVHLAHKLKKESIELDRILAESLRDEEIDQERVIELDRIFAESLHIEEDRD